MFVFFWSAWQLSSFFVAQIKYNVQFGFCGGLGIKHPVFYCALLHISGVVGWPSSPAGPLGVSRTIGPLYGPQQTLYSTTHHCHQHDQNVKNIVAVYQFYSIWEMTFEKEEKQSRLVTVKNWRPEKMHWSHLFGFSALCVLFSAVCSP